MFTSSSVYFFGEIIITSKNVPGAIYLIVSIPSTKFTSTAITIFLARRISSYFPSLLYLRVQSISPINYFIGYADPSFFLNITSNMFLAKFSSGRITSLTLNFLYLKSSIIFTFLRLASINSISIEMLFHIPVITRAPLLITPYIIFRSVFWLSHQISAPYNIVVCTAATWILRVSPGASPYFPVIPCTLAPVENIPPDVGWYRDQNGGSLSNLILLPVVYTISRLYKAGLTHSS